MIRQATTPGAPPSGGKRGARDDQLPTVPTRPVSASISTARCASR